MNIRSNNAVYPGIFGAFDEYTVRMNFVNNETGSYLSSKEISPAEDPFNEFETLQARAICQIVSQWPLQKKESIGA